MPHAERNLRDVSRAPRHQNLKRSAIPTLVSVRLKRFHLLHQFLAVNRTDGWLICDREKHPHRTVARGEGLIFLDRRIARERFQGRRDDPEWIESQFDLRPGRSRFQFGMQPMQPLRDFLRFQKTDGLVESGRLEVKEQRKGDRLQIANAFRRLDGRAGKDAGAPRLSAQLLRELRPELFQFIDIVRLADQGKGQITDLSEITVVNFQSFDRFESAWEKIQHFAVEL